MAPIGYGYGSECHLLRWMGRHRDQRVSAAVGKPCSMINWMDFKFNKRKLWPDSELRGLEFLYDRPNLKAKWQEFWPTGRGIHNWDAVGWIGEISGMTLLGNPLSVASVTAAPPYWCSPENATIACSLASDRILLDENSIQRCRKFVGLLSITYTLSYER